MQSHVNAVPVIQVSKLKKKVVGVAGHRVKGLRSSILSTVSAIEKSLSACTNRGLSTMISPSKLATGPRGVEWNAFDSSSAVLKT